MTKLLATIACVSALSLPIDAQRRPFLRDHHAINVSSATPRVPYHAEHVFAAELRLALRELKFELSEKAPLTVQIAIDHSECTDFGAFCFGGATKAELLFTGLTTNESRAIRVRVGGGTHTDRMPPLSWHYVPSAEDWEQFASIQNSLGGTRYRNFKQRLVREIQRLM